MVFVSQLGVGLRSWEINPTCKHCNILDHFGNQLVDLFSTRTGFSAFQKVKKLGFAGKSSLRVGELEWPQEVVGLLEVGPDGVDLVDKIRTAFDSGAVSESLGDDLVGGNGDALLVDLSESTLVHKLLDGGSGRVSVSHVWFDQSEHTNGGFVQLHKSGVVELTKTEELHNLLGLGGDSDNTANSDDQSQFWLSRNKETTFGLGLTAVFDSKLLGGLVLLVILLGVRFELHGVGSGLFFGS